MSLTLHLWTPTGASVFFCTMGKLGPIYVSAPGKIILHGEHAVVYGKRALAASLDRRAFFKLEETNNGKIQLDLPDIDKHESWDVEDLKAKLNFPLCDAKEPKDLSEAVKQTLFKICGLSEEEASSRELALVSFLYLFCSLTKEENVQGIRIEVRSQLPPSAGLGSSAAFGTCLAAALLVRAGEIPLLESLPGSEDASTWQDPKHLKLINAWAFQAEKIIHGQPSGIDNSISTYGGGILFQGGAITPMKKLSGIDILLTDTKVPRSTKVLVAGVRDRYNKYRKVMEPLLDSIEATAKECEQILANVDGSPNDEQSTQLEELISMNQYLLGAIGVSHPTIEDVCLISKRHGLTTKLTGAGGGGCVFTLLPKGTSEDKVEKMKSELSSKGYTSWKTQFGAAGVTLHFNMTSLDI